MRCSICNKELNINLKFKDILNFEFFCDDCSKDLGIKYSVIPANDGYVFTYYYFTTKDEYVERINNKIFRSLNEILKGTIVFIDNDNAKEVLGLNLKENIKIFSTRYINLEDYYEWFLCDFSKTYLLYL